VPTCNRLEARFAMGANRLADDGDELAANVRAVSGGDAEELDVRLGTEAVEHLLTRARKTTTALRKGPRLRASAQPRSAFLQGATGLSRLPAASLQ
jgi:hypothetical protein